MIAMPCVVITISTIVAGSAAEARIASEHPVYTKVETAAGRSLTVIGNRFLELSFDPKRGGRCSRFRFLDNGEQLIDVTPVSGMFLDHWAKYPWPSGLFWLPYQCDVVGDRRSKIGVRLWVMVPSLGGGKGAENPQTSCAIPTSADLAGLIVRKTIWLSSESDTIEVEQEVENPTKTSRSAALHLQHNLRLNGSTCHDNWYLPSTQGVVVRLQPDNEGGRPIGPDWVVDPTAGWIAVRDRQTDRGLLFAFDYNYVQKLYTSGSTAEWLMEPVPIGPGKTFRTRYTVKPVKGFEDFAYGSERMAADLRADEVAGKVRVRHDLAAVAQALSDVQVKLTVTEWGTKRLIAEKEMPLQRVGFAKVRQEFDFSRTDLGNGVVIRAVVRADGRLDRYEYFYAGDTEKHERRYNYFATKGGALAGARGNAYFLEQPRKAKTFDKPDFAKVARPSPDAFKCLVVFGLYTHVLRIDDALAGWKCRGNSRPGITWANCPPNAIEVFPGTYDELFAYNAIVLSDVNYKAIGEIGFEMLRDYVEQGGRLLVTGGPYAFGNGEFDGTRFPDMLPVTLTGPFDLKWAGKGRSWTLEPTAASHRILEGVSFAQKPRVFWQHFVVPKADAEVVLKAGGHPVLVLGRYGKGRVAALMLSPTGVAATGETPWWDWDGWPVLVRNLFGYLAE